MNCNHDLHLVETPGKYLCFVCFLCMSVESTTDKELICSCDSGQLTKLKFLHDYGIYCSNCDKLIKK